MWIPKMNLLFPGYSSLEASRALLQTGCGNSCDFAVPLGRLWLGNKPHVARTVEFNNAEPGNWAAGSTN